MPCVVMIADGGAGKPQSSYKSSRHGASAFSLTDSWKAEDVFQAVFVVLVGCPAEVGQGYRMSCEARRATCWRQPEYRYPTLQEL